MAAILIKQRNLEPGLVGRGLEGLGLVAGPDGADGLAVDAGVDAVGYGFDFGEFGHGLLQVYGWAWLGHGMLQLRNLSSGRGMARLY